MLLEYIGLGNGSRKVCSRVEPNAIGRYQALLKSSCAWSIPLQLVLQDP